MTTLMDYHSFDGRHPETGSVHNILAYQGVTAPHTGQPYSEAFLLGVSGGIAFGYFTFDYAGYDPILALLTRNTFDPLQTMLERLGIRQTRLQSNQPDVGEKNLEKILANDRPALVWVDQYSLPYNGYPIQEKNWDVQPVVVYGLEGGKAYLADRSRCSLEISIQALAAARSRVKKFKNRVVALDPPEEHKLTAAVVQGIQQCIRLYTEKPPRGTIDNFGLAALQKWAKMLTNTRNPQSWKRFFPAGPRMFAALAGNVSLPGAYGWIAFGGTRAGADRSTYADFLDEAAIILNNPGLSEAGEKFRQSGRLWQNITEALLPENIPLLAEARRLKDQRHRLFLNDGSAVENEIRELNAQLDHLRQEAQQNFPLTPEAAMDFCRSIKDRVIELHDQEKAAIETLQRVMPG
jgi:hypothetical protein